MLVIPNVVSSVLATVLSGWAVGKSTNMNKPEDAVRRRSIPFMPPGWAFGVAWTILYAVIGAVAARTKSTWIRLRILVNLAVNFTWPIAYEVSKVAALAILLWLAVDTWTLVFHEPLLVPYALWLTFAVYLNAADVRRVLEESG